ncbi:hypothetical protein A3C89_03920 [Candidatus Kaiserbacteria bacterium RIFCSPHIGHO2_02_FULL_50_50]|uniref:Addiction module toxin RelE n=1 Tax=Candidatus Kaiserbacteria bacterium RIFCSPHIGHO2_02_FULL_50_50 TaxID=1798492 RepID=A0A1F6DF14_9BACT|nr:MAG: hypothetical protein A3C89_03920 [Candidatus Kaiserbacteria bacterium RIFCSPHIGHO2_02_FULL_50_50]OGG88237.1 MAG: hypothetical protein A3G62_04035 [Candidatus Kaiserbacteria bacterium RIFCSPLOWO2_12_FULL_50_10]
MQYDIVKTKRFKTAYKKVSQLKGFKEDIFVQVVTELAEGNALDATYRDHALMGNLRTFRECHLAPDILLLYQIDKNVLTLALVNIGSHASLFR